MLHLPTLFLHAMFCIVSHKHVLVRWDPFTLPPPSPGKMCGVKFASAGPGGRWNDDNPIQPSSCSSKFQSADVTHVSSPEGWASWCSTHPCTGSEIYVEMKLQGANQSTLTSLKPVGSWVAQGVGTQAPQDTRFGRYGSTHL